MSLSLARYRRVRSCDLSIAPKFNERSAIDVSTYAGNATGDTSNRSTSCSSRIRMPCASLTILSLRVLNPNDIELMFPVRTSSVMSRAWDVFPSSISTASPMESSEIFNVPADLRARTLPVSWCASAKTSSPLASERLNAPGFITSTKPPKSCDRLLNTAAYPRSTGCAPRVRSSTPCIARNSRSARTGRSGQSAFALRFPIRPNFRQIALECIQRGERDRASFNDPDN